MGQFAEEGLQDLFDVYFATPGDFYVGLCSDSVIAKGDGYADLTKVTGSGYSLIQLTSVAITTLGTDNRLATFNEVTFNATGTWTEAVQWFVVKAGVASGTYTLIGFNTLDDGAVTLVNGESVSVTPKISASS